MWQVASALGQLSWVLAYGIQSDINIYKVRQKLIDQENIVGLAL